MSRTTVDATFGAGVKARGGRVNSGFTSHRHCAATESRRCRKPVGDFALEHQHEPVEQGQLFEPADQQGCRDIVGQVRDDPKRAVSPSQSGNVQCKGIACNDMQSPVGDVRNLLKGGEASFIAFDGDDGFCPFLQKRPGQPARARADFEYCRLR